MFSIWQLIAVGVICWIVGMFIGLIMIALVSANKQDNGTMGDKTEKILTTNNILLKISLLKMIVGFAPKDENGCYYTGVDGFISDAFVRLGMESHTVNEQMALNKIERLDEQLGKI